VAVQTLSAVVAPGIRVLDELVVGWVPEKEVSQASGVASVEPHHSA